MNRPASARRTRTGRRSRLPAHRARERASELHALLEPAGVAVGAQAQPAPHEMADTAALLRELSSLGMEDDVAPPPTPRAPHRPAPPMPDKKKKRGLFGR